MAEISLRFYAGLNDFLPRHLRQQRYVLALERRTSIKDLVEAQGVPHTEVDGLLVNGRGVDFSHIVQGGNDISIYPAMNLPAALPPLRPRYNPPYRFVLDCHLGRLARYLRQLGFDSDYRNDFDDEELARVSAQENRILLSRDRNLLKRSIIEHGCYLRAHQPRRQLDEVIARYDLAGHVRPFGLCSHCNGRIRAVGKSEIAAQLAPRTRRYYQHFYQCTRCRQLYWEGSHHQHLLALFLSITGKHPH